MTPKLQIAALSTAPVLLVACTPSDQISNNTEPFDGISEDEVITLGGNEPFWGIEVSGETATYTSPENIDGTAFSVTRFAGNNGLGFSGELEGDPVQIAVTPGACSDTMADREYPYTATVNWGERELTGCAYTDQQPFTGDGAP